VSLLEEDRQRLHNLIDAYIDELIAPGQDDVHPVLEEATIVGVWATPMEGGVAEHTITRCTTPSRFKQGGILNQAMIEHEFAMIQRRLLATRDD
jgi:hypothetical protein